MGYKVGAEAKVLGKEGSIILLATPGPIAGGSGSADLCMGNHGTGVGGANGDFYCKCVSWKMSNCNPSKLKGSQGRGVRTILDLGQTKRVCKHMGEYVDLNGFPVLATLSQVEEWESAKAPQPAPKPTPKAEAPKAPQPAPKATEEVFVEAEVNKDDRFIVMALESKGFTPKDAKIGVRAIRTLGL